MTAPDAGRDAVRQLRRRQDLAARRRQLRAVELPLDDLRIVERALTPFVLETAILMLTRDPEFRLRLDAARDSAGVASLLREAIIFLLTPERGDA